MDFKDMVSLKGKTALIVGSGGLGIPIARAFLDNGADVILAGRHPRTDLLLENYEYRDRSIWGIYVDLLDEDSIEEMANQAVGKTGHIDILVNAAGVNQLKRAEDYDAETWDYVLNVNLRGLHLVTREIGKIMIRQKYGRILSISSTKSFLGTDQDYAAYCASKGAVNMYTKQLACEWGKYGITVNAIAPTFTRTPINSFQLDDPEFYSALVKRIPCGRICTAKDIGCAATFLCSDAAEFISGQVLCIDGGLTAKQ